MRKKLICHVCKKIKKPYTIIMDGSIISMAKYIDAREDGEICERCDKYYAMTGEFKYAIKEEFECAKEASKFAQMMLKWWEKDKKMKVEEPELHVRTWEGTETIARWYRNVMKQ